MVNITQKIKETLRFGSNRKATGWLEREIEDQRRSRLHVDGYSGDQYKILEHPYRYDLLHRLATRQSVDLRIVHESIIKECTRNGGRISPRFMRKCPLCKTEFQTDKETCPDCNVPTKKPDIEQKQKLQAFLTDPNRDDELIDIQVSCLRYMLSCSDWYISIQKADLKRMTPLTIYVEDSTKMHVCVDKHDNLGNGEYFCPNCVGAYPADKWEKGGTCGRCGNSQLKETAYVYKDGQTYGRWARDEMLHGTLDPNRPSRYGLSRVITCLQTLYSIAAMSQFNLDTYTDGKIAKIIGIAGMSQGDVNKLVQSAKQEQNKPTWDPNLNKWVVRKLHQLFLATTAESQGLSCIDIMPDPKSMQSLDWYKLWQTIIQSIYGVQDVFAGPVQKGSTGQNPRMKTDIMNNTTEFYQKAWAEPFNNVIVTQALGVTDWIYKFDAVEEKDDAQDQAILAAKLDNLQKAINLGLNAELTDEGEVKISGQPKPPQPQPVQQENLPSTTTETTFNSTSTFKKEGLFNTEKATYVVTCYDKKDGHPDAS